MSWKGYFQYEKDKQIVLDWLRYSWLWGLIWEYGVIMSNDYLDSVSDFVYSTQWEDLPDIARSAAKNVLMDTLGAILAGSQLPQNSALAALAPRLGGIGAISLFGHTAQTTTLFAAMVNATAGVSLELDEGNRLGGGHPSIHVTPASIAVTEELGLSGKDLLLSLVLGYEVISRVGRATTMRLDVHSHGTWGTIGSAVATAKLMGFDASKIQKAINVSLSMSPANTWTPCLEGATIRNLYPGRSSFNGILACHLVDSGFTGIRNGPGDLYTNLLGDGFDPSIVVEGLDEVNEYRIQRNYFKSHACCLYNHPVLDAVESIVSQYEFNCDQITSILVSVPPIALILDNPEPSNMLATKFSIPYAIGAALVLGRTDVTAFKAEHARNPDIQKIAQKVHLEPDPRMDLRRYDYPSARVCIKLCDDRSLEESIIAQYGDVNNPMTQVQLESKFVDLAQEVIGLERTRAVVETVASLEKVTDITELTRLLRNG